MRNLFVEVRMGGSTEVRNRTIVGAFIFLALLVITDAANIQSILKEVDGSECDNHAQSGRSKNIILGCAPCSQKYFMESYFGEQYELDDVELYGHLAQKFCTSDCQTEVELMDFAIQLNSMRHSLIGEGSHRHLKLSLEFGFPSCTEGHSTKMAMNMCEAVIVKRLPSGVFADPFELQHFLHRGVFSGAAVFGDANLELPSALSNRTIVEVHVSLNLHHIQSSGVPEITTEIPLHARYPPLSQHGYEEIKMNDPDILIRCKIGEAANEKYLWILASREEAFVVKARSNELVWKVPNGNESHSSIVSAITFLCALVAALCIVLNALFSTSTTKSSTKKDF